jgi:hypothetical protein
MNQCEKPFWTDPTGFFRDFSFQYSPECPNSLWNLFARLFLLSFVVGLLGVPMCGATSLSVTFLLAAVVATVIVLTTRPAPPPKSRDVLLNTMNEVQLTPMFSAEMFRGSTTAGAAELKQMEGFAGAPLTKTNSSKKVAEGFVAASAPIISRVVGVEANLPFQEAAPYSGPALPDYTPPTARNLFMNVLIDEYKYNPDRPAAAPVSDPLVKQTMDDYFRVQWFSDPTDVFGRNQSQREFVTQPSTSIPNDRESYQNWLYKIPGKTCKEGGRYCTTQGSAGSPIVWLGEN